MNTTKTTFKSISWQGAGLLLVSIAALCFQINLTRLFSVSQFYHFAFMVVSIALLGMGASGTFLALRKRSHEHQDGPLFAWLAFGTGVSMLGSYLLVNQLPFDSFSIFVDPLQILILLIHYAALALPFFFTGITIGMLLRQHSTAGGEVYAVNLVGSALGCLIAVILPAWVGGEGMVAVSAAMAALAGICFMMGVQKAKANSKYRIGVLTGGLTVLSILLAIQIHVRRTPSFFQLHTSPYKSISYALQNPQAQVVSTSWNSVSKVEVVSSPSLHSLPGLSYRYLDPLPRIHGLFVDGSNLSAILPVDADLTFAAYLPSAIAYQLQPRAEVLVLEPRGGMDILTALSLGAQQVTAVEGNPLIVEASWEIYHRPEVEWVPSSGRSYLRSAQGQYNIIHLPLTDSYHPVGSGAYSLGEDYRYTVEAFTDMLAGLKPNGLLVVTRWLQEVPSEWLRTFTLAVTVLEAQGHDPAGQIIALRGFNTGTLLIKNGPFAPAQLEAVRAFASDKAFDLVFMPTLDPEEINRFNILPEPVYYQVFSEYMAAQPRTDFYRDYPFAVQPPNDDRPFFGHYFKWAQMPEIVRSLGITWQPFGGAGYLVILIIFALALTLSSLLILLPVAFIQRQGLQPGKRHIPLYFGMIGLGFMLVEMPLIQRFILYLDQPAYALAAILFCILLFSGLGSRFGSPRLPLKWALISLVGLLALYSLLLPRLLQATLGLHLLVRLMVTVLILAPMGFLMGIPFPSGLTWMRQHYGGQDTPASRWMVAWIWAVNGASSVLASILASLLALSIGFTFTFMIGMVCYGLAWFFSRQ
jgi:hypothetical protein